MIVKQCGPDTICGIAWQPQSGEKQLYSPRNYSSFTFDTTRFDTTYIADNAIRVPE